ncbi:hypothetical protein ACOMHN_007055 [Nucella lapillus]
MSRKSARLLSKTKLRTQNTESDIESFKRQKIETDQKADPARRKQKFRIETQILPISQTHAVRTSVIVPSGETMASASLDETDSFRVLRCPESLSLPQPSCSGDSSRGKVEKEEEIVHITTTPVAQHRQFIRFSNHFHQGLEPLRPVLPRLNWADPNEMWDILDTKEDKYPRSIHMFNTHPDLRAYMRPVLYTWLTEVCEMYKLHKETYYLAVEYTDRYLLSTKDIEPTFLQLVGATALFLASKVEEIYPPKVTDFAYVCDGAFTDQSILKCEMDMIKRLNWLLSPLTPHMWVQIFLQVYTIQEGRKEKESPSQPEQCNTDNTHGNASTSFSEEHSNAEQSETDSAPVNASSSFSEDYSCAEPSSSDSAPVNASTSFSQEYSGADPLMDFAACALATDSRVGQCGSEEPSDLNSSACESHCESYELHDSDTESFDEDNLAAWCSDEEDEREEEDSNIMYPKFSKYDYMQICQLLDSAILDKHSLNFRYKVIAAAAVYLCGENEDISSVTGLTWPELEPCVAWMRIHQTVILKHEPLPVTLRTYEGIREGDAHLIQRTVISKDIWEEATAESEKEFCGHRLENLLETCSEELRRWGSPAVSSLITPPRSTKKSSKK